MLTVLQAYAVVSTGVRLSCTNTTPSSKRKCVCVLPPFGLGAGAGCDG